MVLKTERRVRRLHATVVATGWASLLNDASSEMVYPLLPVFLTSVLGIGAGFLGLIEGVAESAASLVKLFSGWLSDRLRRRKALVFGGYLAASLARPLLAVATSGIQVLGLRFTDRVGKGLRSAPRDALVADVTSAAHRGLAFGYQRAMDHVGALVGPLIAAVLMGGFALGYRSVFAWSAAPALLCLVVVWVFVRDPETTPAGPPARSPLAAFSAWPRLDPRFRRLLLAVGLFALGNSSDAFLILRARDMGVPPELLPILWMVLHASKAALSIPAGLLSDRVGRRRVIVIGWTAYALVYVAFAFAGSAWQAWALFAAYGTYFALTEGVERAYVADMAAAAERGSAFGLYNFVVGLAALPASVLFGGVWQWLGFQAAFALGAALAVLASLLLVSFTRSTSGEPEPDRR